RTARWWRWSRTCHRPASGCFEGSAFMCSIDLMVLADRSAIPPIALSIHWRERSARSIFAR
ncbi:MAG: hypothetical protein ACREF0_09925, partial [Acetobacteraceae bacterium]